MIEQQQLSGGTLLGKDAEIRAVATERRAKWKAIAMVLDGCGGHRVRYQKVIAADNRYCPPTQCDAGFAPGSNPDVALL
jgi:hypothetical protein